eukprot:2669651-Amphidinium_carterae.1
MICPLAGMTCHGVWRLYAWNGNAIVQLPSLSCLILCGSASGTAKLSYCKVIAAQAFLVCCSLVHVGEQNLQCHNEFPKIRTPRNTPKNRMHQKIGKTDC